MTLQRPAFIAFTGVDRADLKDGRTGLAQNRLPPSTTITDVRPEDVIDLSTEHTRDPRWTSAGITAFHRSCVRITSSRTASGISQSRA